jgi:hypothetical protein
LRESLPWELPFAQQTPNQQSIDLAHELHELLHTAARSPCSPGMKPTEEMVCFVNVESVDRIIYSIFQRFNLEWKTRALNLFTQAA